jgi:hypothetical protein
MRQYPSEDEDLKLAEKVVFSINGLDLLKIPRGAGRSADLLILKNGVLEAYCELKSPRDEWLDKLLDLAKPCQIVGGGREDPIFKKIRKHANKASKQFEAVNSNRIKPNILVFINHDDISNFDDLRETFTGLFYAADGTRHATMLDMAASLERAKSQIDLCVWINGKSRKVEGFFFNQGATPNYLNHLCALLNINPTAIQI